MSEHLSFRAQKTKSSISTEISLVTFTTQIKPTRVLLLCQVHTLRMLVINTMSLLPCPWHLKSISCFTSRIYLEYLYVRYHHCSWIKVAQLYGRHRVISRDPTFCSANAPPTPTKFCDVTNSRQKYVVVSSAIMFDSTSDIQYPYKHPLFMFVSSRVSQHYKNS